MILERLAEFAKTDRIAIYHGDEAMTYRELFTLSQAIGWFLKENFDTNAPVAIYGDKESLMVACMFGAVYAKKTYVIMPSIYPQKRLHYILDDCGADILLNASEIPYDTELTSLLSSEIIALKEDFHFKPALTCEQMNYDDIALIMYTSGSTGIPKGVEMTYGNIELKTNMSKLFPPQYIDPKTELNHTICLSSYGFSMSLDLFSVLGVNGATWHSVPSSIVKSPKELLDYLIQRRDQYFSFSFTPTLAKKLLAFPNFNGDILYNLRAIALGGEALSKNVALAMYQRFPNSIVSNCHGATETIAIGLSCIVNDNSLSLNTNFLPISDKNYAPIVLLDENNQLISEEGVSGEITFIDLDYNNPKILESLGITEYVGNMIAKGYHNNPELTNKHFIKSAEAMPMFKTGDMAYIKDGYWFMVGRQDNQVKVGGNRIELEDVEHNISNCSIVKTCAASTKKMPNGSNCLAALVVLSDHAKDMDQLDAFLLIKQELMNTVESYKIPQKIIFADELPMNAHGKLDRTKLKSLLN